MKYESVADIYSANLKIRENLHATLANISTDEASTLPDGEKWSIGQVVEHISMVEDGIARICSRMIDAAKADGKTSDGTFNLSDRFRENLAQLATARVEAPDRVQPTGDVAVPDSLAKLTAATDALKTLRSDLESIDVSGHTFPHPYFGPLTATEWLVVAGLHERRHTAQIEGILAKLR